MYSSARGEIRRPLIDEPRQKHAAAASSLIKSESWMRLEDHTNLFAKCRRLHKFATTNSNFEKIDYFRHASSYSVDVYQFLAILGW